MIRAITQESVVTIAGRRSRITIRHTLRHARARATYEHLRTTIAEAQARLAAQYALESSSVVPPALLASDEQETPPRPPEP